jgi:hypothetical protein
VSWLTVYVVWVRSRSGKDTLCVDPGAVVDVIEVADDEATTEGEGESSLLLDDDFLAQLEGGGGGGVTQEQRKPPPRSDGAPIPSALIPARSST